MYLEDITTECFILALFIRDDGERFLLGDGAYVFKDKQQHFSANSYVNDVVEVQGNDGIFLAGQVRRPTTQSFDGYIADASVGKTDTETYRREFLTFFRKNYYYTVVYIFPDGSAIQRRKGFIVDAPEAKELYQFYPEYHVALNFEEVDYYSYSEDEDGNETYTKSARILLNTGAVGGGLVWDEYGATWDSLGAIWEENSGGGPTTITVDSIDRVYPIWEVTGPVTDPVIEVTTTGTALTYTGTITASQTLIIDMFNKTAKLNGTSVVSNVSGDWVYLTPGDNQVNFTVTSADVNYGTMYWQEVVG